MLARAVAVAIAVLTVACAGSSEKRIRSQASSDLRCPDPSLKLFHTARDTYTVVGCGRSAEYERKCKGTGGYGARKCRWRRVQK